MEDLRREILGLFAQTLVFTLGLAVALGLGIVFGSRTDGPGGLLVVTLLAGAGLLGAAVVSQVVRDRIVYGRDA